MFNHISFCKSKYTKYITMYIYFYDPCSDWVHDGRPLYRHKKDEREYEYSDGIINSKGNKNKYTSNNDCCELKIVYISTSHIHITCSPYQLHSI